MYVNRAEEEHRPQDNHGDFSMHSSQEKQQCCTLPSTIVWAVQHVTRRKAFSNVGCVSFVRQDQSSDGKISSVRYLLPSAHPCRGSEKTVHVLALTRASVLAGASMYLCADERITHAETETIQNVNVVTSGPMLIQCLTTQ